MKNVDNRIDMDGILKNNPFSAPERYIENLPKHLSDMTAGRRNGARKVSCGRGPVPYFALAASFALMFFVGYAVLRNKPVQDVFLEKGSLAFSDIIPVTAPFVDEYEYARFDVTNDDIVDYLIYSYVPLEAVEYK